MHNFNYYVPTDIYFGEGQIEKLPGLIKSCGNNVLMVYGGGSIKKTGLYDKIAALFAEAGINLFELPGVEPNPRIQSVRKGVELCHAHDIDVVLGVGGGSSIDCAKAIAAGAKYDGDAWELFENPARMKDALPIMSVLTLSATGSEMDGFSVITNLETKDKTGICTKYMLPKASILDPTFTYTVSKFQTASGVADIFSHIIETYFNTTEETFISDRISEGLCKTCLKYGKVAVDDPTNYEARANLMWCSSLAINGLTKASVDFSHFSWTCHAIEHPLSAFYDVTHGAGLAVLTPVWMEMVLSDDTVAKFAQYGRNVFDIEGEDDYAVAKAAIEATREFLISLGLPMSLKDLGVDDESNFEAMAEKALPRCQIGYVPLDKEQIIELLRRCM
ncbi:MAG: iron-containing alcohol dehydrogenase [Christensenellaceae bacterium]|nr:iron-containing alcohol dehydrogenase [Christensenellaceae bacterium]